MHMINYYHTLFDNNKIKLIDLKKNETDLSVRINLSNQVSRSSLLKLKKICHGNFFLTYHLNIYY